MPRVYVYLWLDIEDYVTKEADDAALIFLKILRKRKVPVTCKLVAEEVRALLARGRVDVISAISEFDIGYHSDTHSQHPTVWEYLAELDVFSGAKEFLSRESRGSQLLQEVFQRSLSCYGHPGVMWAPHAYPALQTMGIPMYLDETKIVNLDDQPYWYCGMLNLNGAGRNLIYFDYSFEKPAGIVTMKSKFKRIYERLNRGKGGAVSICLHPHTAVNKTVWDIVNFARGSNRAKEEYERPPAQPPAVTKRAYEQFEEFIQYISSFENAQWITARDALKIYGRMGRPVLDRIEMKRVAKHFLASSEYMRNKNNFLSPAAGFYAVTKCLGDYADFGLLPDRFEIREPMGPTAPFKSRWQSLFGVQQLLSASKIAHSHIQSVNAIPSSLKVGDAAELSPQDFLPTSCKLLLGILANAVPKKIVLKKGARPQIRHINRRAFDRDCKWEVLPPKFKAPRIFEQACLQAWTLRPATSVGPYG